MTIDELIAENARLKKALETEKLVWSIKEDIMRDRFQQCKDAAEYWKNKAEDLRDENNSRKDRE